MNELIKTFPIQYLFSVNAKPNQYLNLDKIPENKFKELKIDFILKKAHSKNISVLCFHIDDLHFQLYETHLAYIRKNNPLLYDYIVSVLIYNGRIHFDKKKTDTISKYIFDHLTDEQKLFLSILK